MSKIDLSKNGLEELIQKFIDFAEEERELALERYRRQDEQMQAPEDFVLQGKNAVDYLKTASERSNSILNAAKIIKEIVFKDDTGNTQKKEIDDDVKRKVLEEIRKQKMNKEN